MASFSSPKVAVIFLQPACNMSCSFCITEDHFDVMSFAAAVELLKTLKTEGVSNIVFGGGEPFTWPNGLIPLTEKAKELGLFVQAGTNGIAMPPGYTTITSIDRYVLPIESADAKTHNAMRFYKNTHHQIIIGRLKDLRAAGKSVTLSTIITKINQNGLLNLASFIKTFNSSAPFIHAWHLYKFIPEGRGGSINAATLAIPDEEYDSLCRGVMNMSLPFKVFKRSDMYHSKTVDFFWQENASIRRASDKRPSTLPGTCIADLCPCNALGRAPQ